MYRTGIGYDIHRLAAGRKLVLGGVQIPYKKGLNGHSDADVIIHAVCDALLGAAALGDIGEHFPDTDYRYKGILSLKLLGEVRDLIRLKGYKVGNIDITLVAQEPKIAPFKSRMIKNIAMAIIWKLTGILCRISDDTFCPEMKETPKSPWRTFPNHRPYCT